MSLQRIFASVLCFFLFGAAGALMGLLIGGLGVFLAPLGATFGFVLGLMVKPVSEMDSKPVAWSDVAPARPPRTVPNQRIQLHGQGTREDSDESRMLLLEVVTNPIIAAVLGLVGVIGVFYLIKGDGASVPYDVPDHWCSVSSSTVKPWPLSVSHGWIERTGNMVIFRDPEGLPYGLNEAAVETGKFRNIESIQLPKMPAHGLTPLLEKAGNATTRLDQAEFLSAGPAPVQKPMRSSRSTMLEAAQFGEEWPLAVNKVILYLKYNDRGHECVFLRIPGDKRIWAINGFARSWAAQDSRFQDHFSEDFNRYHRQDRGGFGWMSLHPLVQAGLALEQSKEPLRGPHASPPKLDSRLSNLGDSVVIRRESASRYETP